MLTRRSHNTLDWHHKLAREQVLQLRHDRWRTDSNHIFKLARKLAIVWLILRHGADLSDVVTAATGIEPSLRR